MNPPGADVRANSPPQYQQPPSDVGVFSPNDKYIDLDGEESLDRSRDDGCDEAEDVTLEGMPGLTGQNIVSQDVVDIEVESSAGVSSFGVLDGNVSPTPSAETPLPAHPDDDPPEGLVISQPLATSSSPVPAAGAPAGAAAAQSAKSGAVDPPSGLLAWLGCCGAGTDSHKNTARKTDDESGGSGNLASTRSGSDIADDVLSPALLEAGMRRKERRMSVTALDKKTLVDLDEGELAEIRAAYTNCDGAFSEAELSHLYADFKLNGKVITQQDFTIIFDTFSRTSVGMADLMFGMYDSDRSGSLTFDGLARALAVFVKGTHEEKIELCFQLLDTDNDGKINRSDIVAMLKFLPMERIRRQNDALAGSSLMGPGDDLKLQTLKEEDETDEGEAKMHKEWEKARLKSSRAKKKPEASYRAAILERFASGETETLLEEVGTPSMRRRADSKRARKKTDAENERVAREVVEEAFNSLQLPVNAPIDIHHFQWACESTMIAQYLIPL